MLTLKHNTKTKPSNFQIKEIALVDSKIAYCRFLNWVIGEFDLFLKNEESEALKVFFPNGWFSISCFQNTEKELNVALQVEGKTEATCQSMMKQIKSIHKHICEFHENKSY
ncbi:hypothetical protein [Aestuariibaculum marinum]|uniref:Uncharacterized protein n=1 Tax=Aestuariibaculum marinum TaxID=2683592 RepID=A0A8J6PU63_9FLAO|nr:hypothetical protein [Aestuariibaculum marinum]MBD0824299.1 hypothetical protein [Aestuariibaculum marinum]